MFSSSADKFLEDETRLLLLSDFSLVMRVFSSADESLKDGTSLLLL